MVVVTWNEFSEVQSESFVSLWLLILPPGPVFLFFVISVLFLTLLTTLSSTPFLPFLTISHVVSTKILPGNPSPEKWEQEVGYNKARGLYNTWSVHKRSPRVTKWRKK